ncbi:polysaccharide pyruvyl transferase family protein [Ruegeria arenilitoris]|uniref:polysaccharide pyruvyl transferase family protein n=1 Tax=Ruegeria arenilitoris TaxID=1173585 RepID=UPI00147A10E4|nr:polysaccharide pyruvyl transferase family protein [Ruegeria arenilitoris]
MTTLIHTGTFDVENYGDLLFPEIVFQHFPQANISHVSPAGSPQVWGDTKPCHALLDIAREPAHAVIVGGGNIIHAKRTLLSSYRAANTELVGYADLWAVIALAAPHEMPVVWNAPGVAEQFAPEVLPLVQEALRRTRYISVRDDESRTYLLEAVPELDVTVVPDSAWDLPSIFSSDQLDKAKVAALTRLGANPEEPYLVFHLNKRYLQDIPVTQLCEEIDGLCGHLSLRPLLIGIGPCHDDDKTANEIAAQLATKPIVMDRPNSIREVAGLIAGSEGYIGSSMHGYITAAAFGVPALVIASGKHKFQGVVRLTGAPETLQNTWTGAREKFLSYDTDALSERFRKAQFKASQELSQHWATIKAIVTQAENQASPTVLNLEKTWEARAGVLSAQLREIYSRAPKSGKSPNVPTRVSPDHLRDEKEPEKKKPKPADDHLRDEKKPTKKKRKPAEKGFFAVARSLFK